MKLRLVLLFGTGLWFASCGLETVSTLNPPPVNYLTQPGDTSVSFSHDASLYAGTDFQGYEVYYKIYPLSGTLARLVADRDSLATSPTVNRLTTTLGYARMTASHYADSSMLLPDQEALLIRGMANGDSLSLDFDAFLNATDPNVQPVLRIQGTIPTKGQLYRDGVFAGKSDQSFSALRTTTDRKSDMDSAWTSAAGNQFEVNVFLVAYGFTPTLQAVRSKPMPWGVIRTIKP